MKRISEYWGEFFKLVWFLVLCIGCTQTNEDPKVNSYYIVDKDLSDDCNVYMVIFYQGECLFHYKLSGYCKNMNSQIYYEEYEKLLVQSKGSLFDKTGFITLDYNDTTTMDQALLIEKISEISSNTLKNKNVKLKEKWENGFTLKVSK